MSAAEVIVVGLGAHGAATLYQLARSGVRALGIDRWSPPHAMGSSHGETRGTRQGVGEGAVYAPLALRSHEIWRELEAISGERLLLTCGMLFISDAESGQIHGTADFVGRSMEVASRFGVPHEGLDAAEITHRFPQFQLRGGERGYYEPGGGLVYPERCIAVQLREAERLGARVLRDTRVEEIGEDGGSAWVQVAGERHRADAMIVTAGAWTPGLVGDVLGRLSLQPQTLHWFGCENPAVYACDRTPVFAWMHGPGPEDSFYGFPIPPDAPKPWVKVAQEGLAQIADPEDLDRAPAPAAAAALFSRHLDGRLRGISPRVEKSSVCLYATSPDAHFRIRALGETSRIIAVSACSGHGFKHSAALGERLARIIPSGPASLVLQL